MPDDQNDVRDRTLRGVRRWAEDYNTGDPDLFVDRNYTDDAVVILPGGHISGIEQFRQLEYAVSKGTPRRRIRVDHLHAIADDRVVVEAVVLDEDRPDFITPVCAILSFRGDKIALDRSYLDGANWLSIEGAEINPGGLGMAEDPLLPR